METVMETRFCYCAQELIKESIEVEVEVYGEWVKDWDYVDHESVSNVVFEQDSEQAVEDAYGVDNMTPLEIIETFHKLLQDERIAAILGEKKTARLLEQTDGWKGDSLYIAKEE